MDELWIKLSWARGKKTGRGEEVLDKYNGHWDGAEGEDTRFKEDTGLENVWRNWEMLSTEK